MYQINLINNCPYNLKETCLADITSMYDYEGKSEKGQGNEYVKSYNRSVSHADKNHGNRKTYNI